MAISKNVASQKIAVYAYDDTTAAGTDPSKTGDAANITAEISLDGAASAPTDDSNPTELEATDHPGIYVFDLLQAETNAEMIVISPVSATSNILIDPVQILTDGGVDVVKWKGSVVATPTVSIGANPGAFVPAFAGAIGYTSPSEAAADRLALSAGQIIPATVDTATNSHTPTTTEFQADDITEATADHYNGRIVVFTSGVLAGQATAITDYAAVGGIGQFTVTAMTEAPSNNDTFIIV